MKKYIQLSVGVGVSVFFIYLALPGLHLQTVLAALQHANYWWLVPGIFVYFVGLWVRTWRWQYTLRPLQLVPLTTLFPDVCIGYFGNNVFPFRAGELLRSYVLKKQTGIDISSSLATVIIERIADGLVMIMFVFLALPFAPMPEFFRNAVITMTVGFLFATALFIWAANDPQRVDRLYGGIARYLLPGKIRAVTDGFFQRFMLGLRSLSSPSDMTAIFLTSVLIWLLETVKYWFVMHAFDFSVGFIVLMLMNGLVNLATTLPAAPGYIGTFDTPGIMTLQAFGVNPSVAASYTFTLHAALWVPVTLLGGYFFWRNHLHMSDIETARQQEKLEDQAPLTSGEIDAAAPHGELQHGISASDVQGTPSTPEEARAI